MLISKRVLLPPREVISQLLYVNGHPLPNRGDATAQNNLGVMYNNGRGVPRDDKTAVKWWTLAAEQGDASAQHNLGFMYNKDEVSHRTIRRR